VFVMLVFALMWVWYLFRPDNSLRNRYFFAGIQAITLFGAGWRLKQYRDRR
jgi:hypothetical protein